MEGSPVRSQQKGSLVQLNESADLLDFQSEFIRLLGSELKHAQVFLAVVDAESRTLQLPAWIKSHLERQPALQKKLEQGEMIGISGEESPVPRPATAARSSVVVVPIIRDGSMSYAVGLVSPLDQPTLSAEDIEYARQFAYDAAPILARLQEIERLRRENQELRHRAGSVHDAVGQLQAAREERNALDAILQMRCHQQAHVAHELRTPLAAIRGYARMLLDGRGGPVNEKQQDYLRVVTENTNRLITLVSWMSHISEMSAQYMKPSTFEFRDVWNDCAAGVRDKLAEKSLQLQQQVPDEPFVLTGDRDKLGYVVNELLTAAIHLAAPAGTLAVNLSHGREGELNFKLSATGAEIPADVLGKIFDRSFNSIANSPAPVSEPGAISLSGVYEVVGMHGGRIFVNSTAGQGANFLFTLPAVTAGGEDNSHEQAVNSSRRRR